MINPTTTSLYKVNKPNIINNNRIIRVLHVDDDLDLLILSSKMLKYIEPTLHVDHTTSPERILENIESYDCIVSDYQMPKMNGIELAQKIREKSDIPFIIYTGQGSEDIATKAFNVGANDYIEKDFEISHYEDLAKIIINAVEKHRYRHTLIMERD